MQKRLDGLTHSELAYGDPATVAAFLIKQLPPLDPPDRNQEFERAEASTALNVLLRAAQASGQLNDVVDLKRILDLEDTTIYSLLEATPHGEPLLRLFAWVSRFKTGTKDRFHVLDFNRMHQTVKPVFNQLLQVC